MGGPGVVRDVDGGRFPLIQDEILLGGYLVMQLDTGRKRPRGRTRNWPYTGNCVLSS